MPPPSSAAPSTTAPAPSPNSMRGLLVVEVGDAGERLGADHAARAPRGRPRSGAAAELQRRRGSRCRRRRCRSRRRARRRARGRRAARRSGVISSGAHRRDEHEVEVGGVDARVLERARGRRTTARSVEALVGGGAAARVDARALDDPRRRRRRGARRSAVGDDLGRAGSGRGRAIARRRGRAVRAARGRLAQLGGSVALGMGESSAGSRPGVRDDALAHAGEHLAGADLDEVARAGLVQGEDRLAPADGADERLGQLGADVGERRGGRAGDRRGSAASRISTSSSAARNGATAGSIAGEWNAPATSSGIARRPCSRGDLLGARRARRASPERTTWPGALSLATVTPAASAIAARVLDRAADAGRASSRRVGLGHQAAAQDDELERVVARRARRRRPARPSSPSEWPAADAGLERRSASQPAIEAQKIAGCAKRVLSSTRGERVLADELDAALEQVGRARATRSRMSGVWLPWPGNSRAMSVRVVIERHPESLCRASPSLGALAPPGQGGYARRGGG